jgi:AbrB family looped-hinge helix DNA binding protein
MGRRGRIVIPAAVRRAAGITEGEDVVIRTDTPGVVVVETAQAIKDRIRSFIPKD